MPARALLVALLLTLFLAGSAAAQNVGQTNIWNRSYSAARQRHQALGLPGVYDPYRHTTHFPGAASLYSSPYDIYPSTIDEGSLRRVSYTYRDARGRPIHVWGERWTSYGRRQENLRSRDITNERMTNDE